ncbi:hypothetical protein P0O15_00945 [Methanotrichaceae archaeon Mx]|uniref:Lipoprotein n=1 Tax=Candidatus Methanocrinis natronophilus TaxID=3033396 RepID=A0ABT5X4X5_9EURY|nr:hypothetical protein [Candidatus Methanocrinis natronophilus]
MRLATLMALALSAIAVLASAAEDLSDDPATTIGLASSEGLGTFLVDGEGMTLYRFADDDPGSGTSVCYDACAERWPVFFSDEIWVPEGLDKTDFQGFVREDGVIQTTYQGWPLYRYFEDELPGDVKGHGLGGVWFVVSP